MGTKAQVVSLLQKTYPIPVANKLLAIANCIGPTDYDSPGVEIDISRNLAGLKVIHSIKCSAGKNATTGRYHILPVFNSLTPIDMKSNSSLLTLIFIDFATGLQPADNTDLSAVKFQIEVIGTF